MTWEERSVLLLVVVSAVLWWRISQLIFRGLVP